MTVDQLPDAARDPLGRIRAAQAGSPESARPAMSPARWQAILDGRTHPTPLDLALIAQAFRVRPAWLITGEGPADLAPDQAIRAASHTGRPGEILITIPDPAYYDTQAGPVEIGIDREDAPALVAAVLTAIGLPANAHGGYCATCGRGDLTPDIHTYAEMAARLHDLESAVNWQTSCLSCARLLDSSAREHECADRAEAAVARVQQECAAILAELHGQHDADDDGQREAVTRILAALTPQPETPADAFRRRQFERLAAKAATVPTAPETP